MEIRIVRIVERKGWRVSTPSKRVVWKCPTCGESMGEPRGHNFYEDGDSLHCHVWENDCNHIAKYDDLQIIEVEPGQPDLLEVIETGIGPFRSIYQREQGTGKPLYTIVPYEPENALYGRAFFSREAAEHYIEKLKKAKKGECFT